MSAEQLADQEAFVTKDLAAVDRSVTPWVVAFSHKSYQMDQTTWAMHDFITKYKVDWWFVGHWHQVSSFFYYLYYCTTCYSAQHVFTHIVAQI
jgi:hypothetical protein